MNILVVDDEKLIREVIKEYLVNENYNVFEASDGNIALNIIKNNKIDLIILDIMMPNLDGFSVCKKLKKDIPVIILSARSEEYDKLEGFSLGIQDYITKPFSPKELIARVKVVLKRNSLDDEFIYKTLKINYLSHEVFINDEIIKLRPKEYELLCYLIKNKNIVNTRENILSNVWGYEYYGEDRTVDTHIKTLRKALKEYSQLIKTIHTVGYKIEIK